MRYAGARWWGLALRGVAEASAEGTSGGGPAAAFLFCFAKKSKTTSPVVDRLLVTFLVLPRKVTKRNRPQSATSYEVPCVARLVRLPHKLARSATRPRAQTYSSEFPDQPPLLGGAQGKKSKNKAWTLRAHPTGLCLATAGIRFSSSTRVEH